MLECVIVSVIGSMIVNVVESVLVGTPVNVKVTVTSSERELGGVLECVTVGVTK